LVSKANATIAKVRHIVDFPDLNDSDFHKQGQKALKEINQQAVTCDDMFVEYP